MVDRINNYKLELESIDDNKLLVDESEYVGIGLDRVIIGKSPREGSITVAWDGTPINMNGDTSYSGKEIYKLSSQHHKNWFILDLETGGRGWYPGAKLIGEIVLNTYNSEVHIKENMHDDSNDVITITIPNQIIEIIPSPDDYNDIVQWYQCIYKLNDSDEYAGFIRKSCVINLNYI